MVAEAANKLRRREITQWSQAMWDRGFGLGHRLFQVKLGSRVCIRMHSFSLCDTLKSFGQFNVNALFMHQAISDGYT